MTYKDIAFIYQKVFFLSFFSPRQCVAPIALMDKPPLHSHTHTHTHTPTHTHTHTHTHHAHHTDTNTHKHKESHMFFVLGSATHFRSRDTKRVETLLP